MPYQIYVSHSTNKIVIHDVNCHAYKNRKKEKTINGYWAGDFEKINDALDFANKSKKDIIIKCGFCIKS